MALVSRAPREKHGNFFPHVRATQGGGGGSAGRDVFFWAPSIVLLANQPTYSAKKAEIYGALKKNQPINTTTSKS